MDKKTYLYVVSGIFLAIALLHIVRIVNGWDAVLGDIEFPMWFSWAAVLISLYLSGRGFGLLKRL